MKDLIYSNSNEELKKKISSINVNNKKLKVVAYSKDTKDMLVDEIIATKESNPGLINHFNKNEGYMTKSQAESYTSIKIQNTGNFTFNEFKYFTNITKLDDSAFGQSYISEITFPPSLTHLGKWIFSDNKRLKNIHIPSTVKIIESGTFMDCSSLTSVTFEDIDGINFKNGMSNMYARTSIDCVEIPSSCKTIQYEVFEGSKISEECINNMLKQLTTVGRSAFTNCLNLKNLIIPSNLTNIVSTGVCFNTPSLETITVDENNKVYRSENNCLIQNKTIMLTCKNSIIPESVNTIGSYAFYLRNDMSGLTLPSNIIYISSYGLGGIQLDSLHIPNHIKSIGSYGLHGTTCTSITFDENSQFTSIAERTFYGNKKLKSIEIPEGVTSIGLYAFSYCDELETIILPSTVTNISQGAFAECKKLKTIICNAETPPKLADMALRDMSRNGTLYIPYGSDYSTWYETSSSYSLKNYNWTITNNS